MFDGNQYKLVHCLPLWRSRQQRLQTLKNRQSEANEEVWSTVHEFWASEFSFENLFWLVLSLSTFARETGSFVFRFFLFSLPTELRIFFPMAGGRRSSHTVKRPPGQKLLHLAEMLFSPKTVSLTFKPLIADWQFEYFEALKNNRPAWERRLISARYYWYFAKAFGLSKIGRLFKAMVKRSSS